MKWSMSIGRIFGTEVKIHATFLLLLIWIGAAYFAEGGAATAIRGTAFILALFACVLMHEFGHILTARRFGVMTRDVILLPIGGVARIEHMPRVPSQELRVAIAGPAVNFAIAALLLGLAGGFPEQASEILADTNADFAVRLGLANLMIGTFNLLPAFPMDGGRVLRALLALRLAPSRATQIASATGQVIAFLLGLLGLVGSNPVLVFIALFVYIGAGSEAMMDRMRDAATGLTVDDAMITILETLGPRQNIDEAADLVIRSTQREMPIVDETGKFLGLLLRDDLIKALRAPGPRPPVEAVMRTDIPRVQSGAALLGVFDRMTAASAAAAAVVGPDGSLIGLVTLENIGELMMIRNAGDGGALRRIAALDRSQRPRIIDRLS